MVARATFDYQEALIKNFTVATGQTATEGKGGTLANTLVQDCTAGQDADVVFVYSATAGQRVSCVVLQGPTPVRVRVGTGGATGGGYAEVTADGFATPPALTASGTVQHRIVGKFIESGVVGDFVGMIADRFLANAAS